MKEITFKINEYLNSLPEYHKEVMEKIRKMILSDIPGITEVFSYGVPGFKHHKNFFYYGSFKNHLGIYPPLHNFQDIEKLKPYLGDKGNLKFNHKNEIPYELILWVARQLYQQYK